MIRHFGQTVFQRPPPKKNRSGVHIQACSDIEILYICKILHHNIYAVD